MNIKIESNDKSPLRFYALEAGDVFKCAPYVDGPTTDICIKISQGKMFDKFPNAVSIETGKCYIIPADFPIWFYEGEVVFKKENFRV